jgi:tRNA (Thr-GGU) A37 N-methylase
MFAQRARHRLNPIGLPAVELIRRQKNRLVVRGRNTIDGTPVADAKPYVSKFDSIDTPRVPAWMIRLLGRHS